MSNLTLRPISQITQWHQAEEIERLKTISRDALKKNKELLDNLYSALREFGESAAENIRLKTQHIQLQTTVQILTAKIEEQTASLANSNAKLEKLKQKVKALKIQNQRLDKLATNTIRTGTLPRIVTRKLSSDCYVIKALSIANKSGNQCVNFGFGVWFDVKWGIEKAKRWKIGDILEISYRDKSWRESFHDIHITNQRKKELIVTRIFSYNLFSL